MLELLGIDDRRLRLKWISASEGAAFAEDICLLNYSLSLEKTPLNTIEIDHLISK